jgi:hypothetical protein
VHVGIYAFIRQIFVEADMRIAIILSFPSSNILISTRAYLPETHTFHHHAGYSSSQIDYIHYPSLVNEYIIDQKSGINLSAHTTVRMRTTIGAPFYEKQVSSKIPAKAAKYLFPYF